MREVIASSKANPILFSLQGWAYFISMYVFVGLLTAIGVSVPTAFAIAGVFGVAGITSWFASLYFAYKVASREKAYLKPIGAILISLPATVFMVIAFWISANGLV